jgi:hypothetical protein
MAFSQRFWNGVEQAGTGFGGLAGAYTFAAAWGSTSSATGLLAGACGILLGSCVGLIASALILPVAIFAARLIIDTLFGLTNQIFLELNRCAAVTTLELTTIHN